MARKQPVDAIALLASVLAPFEAMQPTERQHYAEELEALKAILSSTEQQLGRLQVRIKIIEDKLHEDAVRSSYFDSLLSVLQATRKLNLNGK